MFKKINYLALFLISISTFSLASNVSNDKAAYAKLSARISQAAMGVYDGNKTYLFFGNNNASDTRVNLIGGAEFNDSISVKGIP
jgi:hypothetical protein